MIKRKALPGKNKPKANWDFNVIKFKANNYGTKERVLHNNKIKRTRKYSHHKCVCQRRLKIYKF